MIYDFLEYLRTKYYHEENYSNSIADKIISIFNGFRDSDDAIRYFYEHENELEEAYNKNVNSSYNNGQRFSYFLSIWNNAYQNSKIDTKEIVDKISKGMKQYE